MFHQAGGSTLDGATYSLDNAGNRTAKTDLLANVTTNYGYDAIYELLSATGGSNENYTYDSVGNRLSTLAGSFSYNSSNELTTSPSASYTYDTNGNMLTKTDTSGTTLYAWNFENQLMSVTLPGTGGTTSFMYDPFGRRIQKSSQLGTTNYLYDGLNLLAELDDSGNVLARYTQGKGLDEPLAQLRLTTTSYYDADGLGTITSLSDGTGALTQTYTYDSFGTQIASSGSLTNPFGYAAREFDSEIGIYENRARYFDPNTGRFISEDPVRFNGDGPNFYAYVKNSPVGKFDPTGLATCDYYIQAQDGNGWLYCAPDDPRHSPVSFPAASGNNGDPQHHCKNNPDCASKSGTGPIPPGRYHFSTGIGTRKHNGTPLIPDDPAVAYYRNGLLAHFCLNPFGPSRSKPFCSEGCITASENDIKSLNNLLSSEPNNTLTVYPGLPLM